MTLEELKTLQATGEFHHATYRNIGTLWEGLHVYVRDADEFRGYRHAGVFGKNDPNLQSAQDSVRLTGVSVGAYGRG